MTSVATPETADPAAAGIVEDAVLRTLAYADVFDFALREPELRRYLVGVRASRPEVDAALARLGERIVRDDGLVALAGRAALFPVRQERRAIAARTWPAALRHARAVGSLPYVRMVAVTGALAVGNATEGADIDLLVVTASGRLWTARAATILVVRMAAREGLELCPNYFLAEHRLDDHARDLYAAHELAQMVPVTGIEVYRRLRAANPWVATHLPNAAGAPFGVRSVRAPLVPPARRLVELMLWTPPGGAVEAWEQGRKTVRLSAEAAAGGGAAESAFSAERCKGHFHGHGGRIRAGYEDRLRDLGLEPRW